MKNKNGFTLIELLIVIVIIGILAALITTNLFGARERAGDNQKKTNLNQLKIALQLYYTNYRSYPPNGNPLGFSFNACGEDGISTCSQSTSFTANNVEYLSKIPRNGNQYAFKYYSCNNGDDFRLKTELVNASDQDISESQLRCPLDSCGLQITYKPNDYVICGN